MLEIGTPVLRSSLNSFGEIDAFGSTWVKPSSLALAANSAMRLNLPLAHMVERETSGNCYLYDNPRKPCWFLGRITDSSWSRSTSARPGVWLWVLGLLCLQPVFVSGG